MRKFTVKLNGVSYDVEIEEMSAAEVASKEAAKPADGAQTKAATPPHEPVAPAANANKNAVSGKGTKITSPMPGTILNVKINVGDRVKSGDVLFIIEAMKLESEIVAPNDGEIVSVAAIRGKSVNSGETLCVIA